MIDEEWLRCLRFETVGGYQVTGLLGMGSEAIVFECIDKNGNSCAMRVPKINLGFHIKELPFSITAKVEYDVNRLNKKLLNVFKDECFKKQIDGIIQAYDDLYIYLIKFIYEYGLPSIFFSTKTPDSLESLPFILQTPGMKRRLIDWATLSEDNSQDEEIIIKINGFYPKLRIITSRPLIKEWASKILSELERKIPGENPDYKPDKLPENPLFIWGGAVMDYFFTDDEMPIAVEFIKENFGNLPEHPEAYTFLLQAQALANLIAQFVEDSELKVKRFVKFCSLAGFRFQAFNRNNEVIADGFCVGDRRH